MTSAILDFEIKETLGIDIEKEDRSVGIFGNNFILTFNTWNKKQVQLLFFDEEFDLFLDKIKPFIDNREARLKAEEQMERDMVGGNDGKN